MNKQTSFWNRMEKLINQDRFYKMNPRINLLITEERALDSAIPNLDDDNYKKRSKFLKFHAVF